MKNIMLQTQFGKCIYTSPSGFSVYQNILYRWLSFGNNTLQSVMNRHFPQRPVLLYLQALSVMAATYPAPCCILGLGGAGISHMLARSSLSITAVEKEIEVIEIGRRFFMLDRVKNTSVVHDNALDYVRKCSIQYQHLLIDLYNSTEYPAECATEEFFLACKNILHSDGFIAINLANSRDHWPIFQLIKEQFKSTLLIPIKKTSNLVIIASNNPYQPFYFNKVFTIPFFKKIEWIAHWGYVASYGKR